MTVRTVAHRGFAGVNPENTVAAVRAAANAGVSMVEVDAVPTADGDVVAFHDRRLGGDGRRLTDGSGLVWERSTAAVRAAEVLDSGETVPTLDAVLAATPPDVAVNVELKNPGTADVRPDEALDGAARDAAVDRWAGFVDDVLAVLDDHATDALLSSFCEGALAAAAERSRLPLAVLFRDAPSDGVRVARRCDADALHPPWTAVAGPRLLAADPGADPALHSNAHPESDADLLAVADAEGWDVNVWTVSTWVQAHGLRAAGVDGLIADYPGLLRD